MNTNIDLRKVLEGNFLALYDQYGAEKYQVFDTYEEAENLCKVGDDGGHCISICVIDLGKRSIVWKNIFLPEEEIIERAKDFMDSIDKPVNLSERYLVFNEPEYYPSGGLGDVTYTANTIEEIEKAMQSEHFYISSDCFYVWDKIDNKFYELDWSGDTKKLKLRQ